MEYVEILKVKSYLKQQLCKTKNNVMTFGYDKEKKSLKELLQRCVAHGVSESILMIGPRGSGKTKLLEEVLHEVRVESKNDFRIVSLNGFLLHDDKASLQEMARQLDLEISLKNFNSFQETLIFLLSSAFSGSGKVPLVFILDEFDNFLQHKNQTLLYNLLDTMNNFEASICIIGLTSRMDVIEMFEKRVKSRFSHRQIQLCLNLNFDQYKEVFRSFLGLSGSSFPAFFVEEWDSHIRELCEGSTIQGILRKMYDFDGGLNALQTFLLYPVSRLSVLQPRLEAKDFISSYKIIYATNSKSAMLQGLSILELSLVVAAANIRGRYGEDAFNFEMVYNEYKTFCQSELLNLIQEKAVVFKAYENLYALELLCPVESPNERVKKEYWLMNSAVHYSELVESLNKVINCPTQIRQWLTAEANV